MYIDKREFEQGSTVVGEDQVAFEAWLDSINCDLAEEAVEVFGAFEDHAELDDLIEAGELLWRLDGTEYLTSERLVELESDGAPTEAEISAFKALWVEDLLLAKGEGSTIFLARLTLKMNRLERLIRRIVLLFDGLIKSKDVEIWVFARKYGDSFDGVSAHFMGASLGGVEHARRFFSHGVLVEA